MSFTVIAQIQFTCKRSRPEVFLVKGVLKTCSKFTGESTHARKCDFNKEHFSTAASEYANVCDLFHQYILPWNYETNFECFII